MQRDIISYEPATGAVLWQGAVGDVDGEVVRARAGLAEWAQTTLSVRNAIVRTFADSLKKEGEALATMIARETGKPLWEARTEVTAVAAKAEISIEAHSRRATQSTMESSDGARSATRYKPHGVLAVLGPYNFPAHLPNGHILPALLAGNAVVFKPSEKTPASGALLVELYHRAGVPENIVRLLVGDATEGQALAEHDDIDGLLFTGSAKVGLALNRLFADKPNKILALEMGGNNPIVVWDTKNLDSAATIVVRSAFMSAGQRCTSARRLIVHKNMAASLLERIYRLANRLIVGDPFAIPAPYMGPLIDNATADQLIEGFLGLMSEGGEVIRYMTRPDRSRSFVTPGIIDVTAVENRPDRELFGPLLQVIQVESFEEAIAEANNTAYGLSAALIGGKRPLYERFWSEVRAGVINWNNPTNGASSYAPFGGIGLSGNHRPSAYFAADYCSYPIASAESDVVTQPPIATGLRAEAS